MHVLIVDYGMSNLGSIRRSLERCGVDVLVSDDYKTLKSASHVVLPGVGSFSDGMTNLHKMGWVVPIQSAVKHDQIPLLGICLGMQLLADWGYEGGKIKGLGLVPGEVKRLEPESSSVRIPHVGWNEVHKIRTNPLFDAIPDGSDFYFVHSYHFIAKEIGNIIATTPYCNGFASAIASRNVYGVQFHPEKSGNPGFHLLKNFLNLRDG